MNFEQMATSLRQTPNFMQGTGATAAEIAEAEARLGPLPSDYKRFLSEFGWVHFGYDDIYGLGSELPYPEYSVLATTVRERESFGLPASLIAISNDGGGNLSCFKVAEFGQEPDGPYSSTTTKMATLYANLIRLLTTSVTYSENTCWNRSERGVKVSLEGEANRQK